MTNATLTLQTIAVVGLYVFFTAPFLGLLLFIHRLQSSYTGLFMAAIVLQLIPIGLIFFPLGFIGVGLLAFTLVSAARRNKALRLSGLHNPQVLNRWTYEYIANLWAFGLALEQKGAALVFIQVTSRGGLNGLWEGFVPASLIMWLLLGPLILRAHRTLTLTPAQTDYRPLA